MDVQPAAEYAIAKRAGNFISSAGMTPKKDNTLVAQGKVGTDFTISEGQELAALATQRALAAVQSLLNKDESLQPWQLTVYVSCEPHFTEHSAVADGSTKVILENYGDLPSRAAIGVSSLPGNAPLEIVFTAFVQ